MGKTGKCSTGWFALLLVVVVVGCGDGLVDMKAKVLLDGEPLEGASVTLYSVGEQKNRTASGQSDAQGLVTFTTFEPGDGVLPGEYKAVVIKSPNSPQEELATLDPNNREDLQKIYALEKSQIVPFTRTLIPRVYLNAQRTPLSVTVPPEEEPVVLELDSKIGKR